MVDTPSEKPEPKPEHKPKGKEEHVGSYQTEWFQRNKGKVITVRLMDGTRLSGALEGWDTYTVAIRVAGREEAVMLNKHGVALFMRREGEDKDKEKTS